MDFSHVEVLWTDPGNFVGFAGRALGYARLTRLMVLARTHHRGFHIDRLACVVPGTVGTA